MINQFFHIIYFIGGCYDTAKRKLNKEEQLNNFIQEFQLFINKYFNEEKQFYINSSIKSPDNTSLFCTSGMHHFKDKFIEENYKNTIFNIQKCLRLNDLEEIGDSTHYLTFHMLGMFSFRQLSLQDSINFWLSFLKDFNLYPHYVTIHPDKLNEWSKYYPKDLKIVIDENCKWSDGNIGGYCTEFYYNDIEIGNIVNPLGTCIDVGFGLERLLNLKYGQSIISKEEILKDTIMTIINDGFIPGDKKQGHILKKLLIMLVYTKDFLDHPFYWKIYNLQCENYDKFLQHYSKPRNKRYSKDYWFNSWGYDIDNLSKYENIKEKHNK